MHSLRFKNSLKHSVMIDFEGIPQGQSAILANLLSHIISLLWFFYSNMPVIVQLRFIHFSGSES